MYLSTSILYIIEVFFSLTNLSGGGRRVRRTRTVALAKRASPAARSRLAKPLATAGNSFGIGGASSALVYCHAILKRGADQVALSVKEKQRISIMEKIF